MKRTNIYLDEEQARLLRHLSIEEGRSFTDIVREALNEYLDRRGLPATSRVAGPRRPMTEDERRARLDQALERVGAAAPDNVRSEKPQSETTALTERYGRDVLVRNVDLPMDAIRELCQRYQVRELSVFGSALREDFHAESDIDFLVEFQPEAHVSYLTLFRVQGELSTILERKVDLVPKAGLKPRIRESVLTSARVLYAA